MKRKYSLAAFGYLVWLNTIELTKRQRSVGLPTGPSAPTHSEDSRLAGSVPHPPHGTDALSPRVGRGSPAAGGDPRRSEPAAEARGAGPDRAALGRPAGRGDGRPAGGEQPPGSLALAAALRRSRGRRPPARQDPKARQGALGRRTGAPSGGADLRRAARRGDALDRPDDGQGGRHLLALRAADLGRPQAAAAPAEDVQA